MTGLLERRLREGLAIGDGVRGPKRDGLLYSVVPPAPPFDVTFARCMLGEVPVWLSLPRLYNETSVNKLNLV